MISLVIPTRSRVTQLDRLLLSITQTVTNRRNIEIFLRADEDDEATLDYMDANRTKWDRATIGPQPRNLAKAQNDMWRQSRFADHFWLLNDDAEILTPGWDELIERMPLTHLGRTSPVADLAAPGDQGGYSEFPVIGREAANALGWLMPPWFAAWDAEVYAFKVYSNACRVYDLRDIHVRHDKSNDATRYAMKKRYTPKLRNHVSDVRRLLWA